MEVSLLDGAAQAFFIMIEPTRLLVLSAGVILGLIVGIIPGIGGLAGTALVLPFTFVMDPATAIAFLLGLGSVVATGDPIPAILFGVPGTAGSAATVVDGLPMAKRGEAGRALAAAYMSSLLGGLFGAVLLGLSIPLLRPLILHIGSPELLAFALFGISMVAVLSGNAPLRGLTAACLGILFAMVGSDPQTGTLRWTMDLIYLYDRLPLLPVVLGIFALPELADLAIGRSSIAKKGKMNATTGMWVGTKDVFRNWWLVLRCSWIGTGLGAIPGIGSAIIDWVAYGHAAKTVKGGRSSFGKGDVRGVIASESANNAREGGVLVPTIAFGVPGSAGMALLLSAFIAHGLIPGPEMLTKNIGITYSMVWSIAIANILGAGLCFAFSGQLARVAMLRYTIILPAVMSVIYIGAFSGSRSWGDLIALLLFGVLGWIMKQLKWPRPPLILGFVLGVIIEQNLFISVTRFGLEWLSRPIVIVVIVLSIIGFAQPMSRELRAQGGLLRIAQQFGKPRLYPGDAFYFVLFGFLLALLAVTHDWERGARLVPVIIAISAIIFSGVSLLNLACRRDVVHGAASMDQPIVDNVGHSMHMDVTADTAHLATKTVIQRASIFLGWMLAFLGSIAVIGLIPTVPIFVVLYMRIEGREPWKLVLSMAVGVALFVYLVFDVALSLPWPNTLLGSLLPVLKVIPSL